MFEHVLIGVDGGPGGRDALQLARMLAAPTARLALVHVRSEQRADRSLALLETEAGAARIQPSLISVREGTPGRGLHRQAEQQGADLLVVGSCARTPLGRAALGDDTRAALNGSPCAVAVAAAGVAGRPRPIAQVGVGYDGSPESIGALATARRIAAASHAAVRVLQVVSLPVLAYTNYVGPAVGDTIDELLAAARHQLAQLPEVESRAVYGTAGEKLAAFGDEVDILVVGSRGYGPLHRLIAGSTCDYLERHARCSLVVTPRSAPATSDDVVIRAQPTSPAKPDAQGEPRSHAATAGASNRNQRGIGT